MDGIPVQGPRFPSWQERRGTREVPQAGEVRSSHAARQRGDATYGRKEGGKHEDNVTPYGQANYHKSVPFPVDDQLSQKIYIWQGLAWHLQVDAVVINTNESLSDRHGSNKDIFRLGGSEVLMDCTTYGHCRTGSSIITRAGLLPCRRLIHTVSPRYSEKYHIAADNALHHCLRSCMRLALDHKLRTVAFTCIYPERKKYPPKEGDDVVLRSVRRFLEHFASDFDQIIFCFESEDEIQRFEAKMPIFFPRDEKEVLQSCRALDGVDVGNDWGERVIEERRIRVSSVGSRPTSAMYEDWNRSTSAHSDGSNKLLLVAPPGTTRGFFEMVGDHDQERKETIQRHFKAMTPAQREEYRFRSYLGQCRRERTDDIEAMHLFYVAGEDTGQRPVLVILAQNFDIQDEDPLELDRVLLHAVRVLERVAKFPYTILYLHADLQPSRQVPVEWVREVLTLISKRYSHNLRAILVVEASWWLRVLLWSISFTADSAWQRLRYVDHLSVLRQFIVPESLDLPQDVWAGIKARGPAEQNAQQQDKDYVRDRQSRSSRASSVG